MFFAEDSCGEDGTAYSSRTSIYFWLHGITSQKMECSWLLWKHIINTLSIMNVVGPTGLQWRHDKTNMPWFSDDLLLMLVDWSLVCPCMNSRKVRFHQFYITIHLFYPLFVGQYIVSFVSTMWYTNPMMRSSNICWLLCKLKVICLIPHDGSKPEYQAYKRHPLLDNGH
jgi:hypothetical protein